MTKRGRKKDIGTAMLGFAVLMFGMNAMSAAVKPLANDPAFAELMIVFTNPILAMLIGAVGYRWFRHLDGCMPTLIFLMLFFTFCKKGKPNLRR